jgi:hypothetical protein
MIKYIILSLWLVPLWTFSQNEDLREEIRKNLRLEDSIASLNRKFSLISSENINIIDSLNTRLIALNTEIESWSKFADERKQLSNIKKELTQIQKENQVLSAQLIIFETLKKEKEQIQREVIHLTENKRTLSIEITELQQFKTGYSSSKQKQENYLLNLISRYNIDDMVIIGYSLITLEADLDFLLLFNPDNKKYIDKIGKWITIKNAQNLLAVKFSETEIKSALNDLNLINDISIINELKKDLELYSTKNNIVIDLLAKLNQINAIEVKGLPTDIIQEKRKDIYAVLSLELDYNAEINRAKYIYLNEIIELIKKTKDSDIDADLTFIKDLL